MKNARDASFNKMTCDLNVGMNSKQQEEREEESKRFGFIPPSYKNSLLEQLMLLLSQLDRFELWLLLLLLLLLQLKNLLLLLAQLFL